MCHPCRAFSSLTSPCRPYVTLPILPIHRIPYVTLPILPTHRILQLQVRGGRLVALYNGAVRTITRGEGEATVHSSSLMHGVTRTLAGERYSLIMFFG